MSRRSKKKHDAKKKRKRGPSPSRQRRHPRGRWKVPRPWSMETAPDGQRMILLRIANEGSISFFDDNDRPLRADQLHEHEGNIWADKPPTWKGVRDWFQTHSHEGMGLSAMPKARYDAWQRCYDANRSQIVLAADDVPEEDVAYIVAEGPSLERNGHELLKVTRGATVAVNRVVKHLPPDAFDYYFAVDFKMDIDDGGQPPLNAPYPKTTAVFDPVVNPKLLSYGWKEVRWFMPNFDLGHPVYDAVVKNHPHLPRYDCGLNCTFQALGWACFGLFKIEPGPDRAAVREQAKGKTIVLVGQDCCYTYGRRRAGQWLMYDHVIAGDIQITADVSGHAVMTNDIYRSQSHWMMAAMLICREAGIRVINATEGGLLKRHCEQMTLADAVSELNKE